MKTNRLSPRIRVGLGYDVHAFAYNRDLILGGVHIEHPQGLEGHSDADVVTHAVMDALLSALRKGDIGKLFPDTDKAYKGADSIKLLSEVGVLISKEGWEVLDIDVAIACESPKLSPHRDEMRNNIAHALSISPDQVGVKASTAEKLGFVGRGEGIETWAVCLLTEGECT